MATIQAAQNQKQTNTGGLAKLLVKNWCKVMLKVNLNIQDRLISGQTGNISHIEFAQGSVWKTYVKFSDKQAGVKAMRSSFLGRQSYWMPIEKCEAEIPIPIPSGLNFFYLILLWGSTFHKFLGSIDFDLQKQK